MFDPTLTEVSTVEEGKESSHVASDLDDSYLRL